MKKTFKIAKWEIKKNLTNKTFLVSIILTPLLMVIFGALPTFLQTLESDQVQKIYVLDQIDAFEQVKSEVDTSNFELLEYKGELENLKRKVVNEPNSSFILLDQTSFQNHSFMLNVGHDGTIDTTALQSDIDSALKTKKLEELGIERENIEYASKDFSLSQQSLLSENADIMSRVIPAVFSGLILISIFISGMMTFQSATQEKRDKMTEVLLSSVEPKDIMQGKILGYFALGIIQVLVWATVAAVVATVRFDIPVVDYLLVKEFPLMLLYSLLGYLLFSSIFVSMGATVNDIYSSGNLQGIIMILPILPVFFVGAIISNPHGIVAKVGSFFPLSTSGVMIIRFVVASKIPAWEILATLLILILTTLLVMVLAGKVFKTALLMYGKNATPAEIIKWIRQ